jgi:hypothetical protein
MEEAGMKPTVGNIVRYVTSFIDDNKKATRAAIVTGLEEEEERIKRGEVSLAVFHVGGIEFVRQVSQDEGEFEVGTWHWPVR